MPPWRLHHQNLIGWFDRERHRRKPIGYQVYPEYLDRDKRKLLPCKHRDQNDKYFPDMASKPIKDKILYILEYIPSFFNSRYYRCEIIIRQDHIRCFFTNG